MISSTQNPQIKHLLLLQQKSSQRRAEGLFVVEGRREVEHCLAAGYALRIAFICEEIAGTPFSLPKTTEIVPVSRNVYERIAYRGGTEGIVALVEARNITLADLQLSSSPLIVVLESVEKPGNLGAVLRSADAAGADAVIVCDPLTDLYNPNLIRSAVGALFTVPCVACTTEECVAFFKEKGIRILTAQLQDSSLYYDTPMTGPTAIVMGTEATGLTDLWRKEADAHIRIPMLGHLDSLNVSVSAAILLFEAVRQRQI
ncbi:MAG: RNA methyltransferase, partial [Bacteroidaceae bacterium]|nr:RNA methyltransferase [Bacteroidaceae bacterium]